MSNNLCSHELANSCNEPALERCTKAAAVVALSLVARCIVIGPVCGRVCNGRAGGRAVSVTTITRNCVHRSPPNWVCRCR